MTRKRSSNIPVNKSLKVVSPFPLINPFPFMGFTPPPPFTVRDISPHLTFILYPPLPENNIICISEQFFLPYKSTESPRLYSAEL